MRKILSILLLICFTCSLAFAWGGAGDTAGNAASRWKTYQAVNSTGEYVLTSVPTTTIIPQVNVILGFEIMGIAETHSENVVTLYDGNSYATDELIGEVECADESFDGLWYPRPKVLEVQLFIWQGPSTIVTIFFE
jgi:hypothetical protein